MKMRKVVKIWFFMCVFFVCVLVCDVCGGCVCLESTRVYTSLRYDGLVIKYSMLLLILSVFKLLLCLCGGYFVKFF